MGSEFTIHVWGLSENKVTYMWLLKYEGNGSIEEAVDEMKRIKQQNKDKLVRLEWV